MSSPTLVSASCLFFLFMPVFLIITIPVGVRWNLLVGHLFMCVLAFRVFFGEMYIQIVHPFLKLGSLPFYFLVHFILFFWVVCLIKKKTQVLRISLYILDTYPLSDPRFLHVSPHSVHCLSAFFTVSSSRTAFNFDEVQLVLFFFF